MRRNVLIVVGAVFVVVSILSLITGGKHSDKTQGANASSQKNTQKPAATSSSQGQSGATQGDQTPNNKSSPTQGTSAGQPKLPKADPKHEAVANAAGVAYSGLNDAQILPLKQLREKVNYYVVPTMRTVTADAFFREGGPTLAAMLKYPNVAAARQKPCCYYLPQMWRMESYNGHTASVSLFVYVHWQTIDDKQSNFNDVVIVKMRKRKGRWLYVGSQPGRTPPKVPGKAIPRKDFDPYLEGFRDFVKTD
jgi:hypothetical protein